jgi:large subunit ribosomal protein L7Ae
VAKAPAAAGGKGKKEVKNPLFEAKPRNFGIGVLHFTVDFHFPFSQSHAGQDIQHPTDLTRFVKWPEYVRLQRQKVILNQRLKVNTTWHNK